MITRNDRPRRINFISYKEYLEDRMWTGTHILKRDGNNNYLSNGDIIVIKQII